MRPRMVLASDSDIRSIALSAHPSGPLAIMLVPSRGRRRCRLRRGAGPVVHGFAYASAPVGLAFAEDHSARAGEQAERFPRRRSGCPVGALPIAATGKSGGRQRRRHRVPKDLESQASIQGDIVRATAPNGQAPEKSWPGLD